jgi:bifunctional ADP-heptose synthase (sugar kinase/adenylyltransferase)
VDHTRPTTHKERFIAEGYKMLQVDRVDNRTVPEKGLEFLASTIRDVPADIIIFSDFRHGIFNGRTVELMSKAMRPGALKVADSQVSNRWGNILDFKGFDLLTPNEREVRFALGDQDSVVRPLASRLFEEARCRYLILKMGERGLIGYRGSGPGTREFFTVDSFVERLVDPIGAGDALLSHAALALAKTDNIVISAILGSVGAAIACERQGNVPVSPREVDDKLSVIEKRARYEDAVQA